MELESVIVSAIRHLGNLRFDIDKIIELTKLPRKKVSSSLSKMANKDLIERVNRGVYINKTIDLTQVNIPNTIEILPKFMKFNEWKVAELHDLGFNLNFIKVVAAGSEDGRSQTFPPRQVDVNHGERIKTFTVYEKRSAKINSSIVHGYEHDSLVPALARRFEFFKFKIPFMSITSIETGDVIVVKRINDRFFIHSINGTTFGSTLFDMDYIAKILGDLYQATCSVDPGFAKKTTVCHPSI